MFTILTRRGLAAVVATAVALSLLPLASAIHEQGHTGGITPPPVCAKTLMVEARDDGAVALDWEPVVGNEDELRHYRVIRWVENDGAGPTTLGETSDTSFVDETAEPGATYWYQVQAHGDGVFTTCGSAEVTAVPFFGAPILTALAGAGGVAAYALLRRR